MVTLTHQTSQALSQMLNLFKGIALVRASIYSRVVIMNNGSLMPANYLQGGFPKKQMLDRC